ncbi:sister chromatid cohesion protein PDS5 homolog B isoform X3 [Rhodamnia argentea]|uniref:Sister chromatid cohesion protein PDS5 homolog B isoform X3 n=1 Tax=Rhodamnia argentea TaxID=178133 RepID=A0A8B8P0D0_9MYRT|nr:sister chromatid cohesion protein PDS5 homolog B isoform X3 [Rhodamnia argentea]
MDEPALQLVTDVGAQILRQSRPNKDFLVKSLRKAASALSQIEQSSVLEAARQVEAAKKVQDALKPLRETIVKHSLARHKDRDVRLLVSICASEIFRVMAPEPPFEDKYLPDIFKLIASMFEELADTESPYFSKRVKILETVARCKCWVVMLDSECSDLILEMFNVLFSIVREKHEKSLINDIMSILTHIIDEEASEQLLEVILRNLLKEEKGVPSASSQLAVSVLQTCCQKLEPFVRGFLTSCIMDRDAEGSALREIYHKIILKIFICTPQMLFDVIPNLTQELLTDQVDVRIKAVSLVGKIFAVPGCRAAQNYHDLFVEFLNRFSDKSVEVRVTALQCVKDFCTANPTGAELNEVLSALEGRLLDIDDRVRIQAVAAICDLAKCNLKFIPLTLISQAAERLRDKKISVRKKALQKLMEVYRSYCSMCAEGNMTIVDHFERIPCNVLMLSYDRDCKEFRSQNMELLLAEDLFPDISLLERTMHWVHMFSLFTSMHVKALDTILSQKRRLQSELRNFLALRKKEKETCSDELEKKIKASFERMSASFLDPTKAEECFYKLDQMKDNYIFNSLAQLLDEASLIKAQHARENFMKKIRDRHPHVDFLRLLSAKCIFNIFSSEHVQNILNYLSSGKFGGRHLEVSSIKLLMAIVRYWPSLLKGSEVKLCYLLERNEPYRDQLTETLAKAGSHIFVKLSDIYPILERMCLEGTRAQSKVAVSAIAAVMGSAEQYVFSELTKRLVDSLHSGKNLPTVLQSLGCLAQHSTATFEELDGEITPLLLEKTFQMNSLDDSTSGEETSGCSNSCKLRIYGLKALVKSFLPHHGSQVRRNIDHLLSLLVKMLQEGKNTDSVLSSGNDSSHIRLAAAKSVLRLSKRWDLHISPEIFHLTILTAKSLKYMGEFVKDHAREACGHQTSSVRGCSITGLPVYILVFLIHVLAHDEDFPPEKYQDEHIFCHFCSPLFHLIQALVNPENFNGDLVLIADTFSQLFSIFKGIRKAEDAVDAHKSPRLHILSDIGSAFTSSLNQGSISSSCSPGVVLLPSSIYTANTKGITRYAIEEGLVEKIIELFKNNISKVASSLAKYGRSVEHHEQPENTKSKRLRNVSHEQANSLTTRNSVTRKDTASKMSAGMKRKHAASPDVDSDLLGKEFPPIVEHGNDGFEPTMDKEQLLSSCDSVDKVTTLTEKRAKSGKTSRNGTSLKENTEAGSSVTTDSNASYRAKLRDPSRLKETCRNKEVQVLQQIKLFSIVDECSDSRIVDGFSSESNDHKVKLFRSGNVGLQ